MLDETIWDYTKALCFRVESDQKFPLKRLAKAGEREETLTYITVFDIRYRFRCWSVTKPGIERVDGRMSNHSICLKREGNVSAEQKSLVVAFPGTSSDVLVEFSIKISFFFKLW